MRSIGIRAKPTEVVFAIFDSKQQRIINIEALKIPKALNKPEALKYVRNHVIDILNEYEVDTGGIRITESSSRNLSIDRIEIEGVIQEAFSSSTLKSYYSGQIATIAAKNGFDRTDFKKYVDGEIEFNNVENWDNLSKLEREAIITAFGAQ